ncbi:MAG: TolC family protein [Phycisphaeraceae bacterium]|nr:TolC family protein [Phycisphaeraceae bacterium]
MRTKAPLAAILASSLLAGCSSMKPGLGFDDVKQSIAERSGEQVHWNNGTPEDAQAKAAVATILEGELTADQAVQVALLNNHELQAVYEELNLAQSDVVQAGLLKNPVFSGDFRFGVSGVGPGVDLGIAQDFLSLLAMPLKKGRAEAAFEAAKVRVTAAVLDTAFEVRTAFYDYQAARQMREMRETVVEATGASYELAGRLRDAGNIRELDLSNERALKEQSKIELAAAQAEEIHLRERMNALMGLWGSQTLWVAAARLPALPDQQPPQDGLEAKAIRASLDLALLRREAEIAARSAGMAKPFAWLDGTEIGAASERELEGEWSVGPSLAVPIPIFDQGQAALGAAQARYKQAAERTIARAVEIRSRVRAAQSGALSAFERARYYEKVILPLRQKILDETQDQYNAMQISGFQLLQAKRDQIAAGAEYIASVHGYWQAKSELDQILSGRMTPFERTTRTAGAISTSTGASATGEHQ